MRLVISSLSGACLVQSCPLTLSFWFGRPLPMLVHFSGFSRGAWFLSHIGELQSANKEKRIRATTHLLPLFTQKPFRRIHRLGRERQLCRGPRWGLRGSFHPGPEVPGLLWAPWWSRVSCRSPSKEAWLHVPPAPIRPSP